MPIVTVTLVSGQCTEIGARLCTYLSDTVRETVGAVDEAVTVALHEVPPNAYRHGRGGAVEAVPPPAPEETVRAFLAALDARDFVTARSHVGPRFSMMYPGGVRMRRLEDVDDWAAQHYATATKSYQRFDVAFAGDGTLVFGVGTLSGTWRNGNPFAGVRFIDRFRLSGGRILEVEAWTDVGEFLAAGLSG